MYIWVVNFRHVKRHDWFAGGQKRSGKKCMYVLSYGHAVLNYAIASAHGPLKMYVAYVYIHTGLKFIFLVQLGLLYNTLHLRNISD